MKISQDMYTHRVEIGAKLRYLQSRDSIHDSHHWFRTRGSVGVRQNRSARFQPVLRQKLISEGNNRLSGLPLLESAAWSKP